MVTAIASAERVAVPLNTRCSIRWEMPPRSSGSTREPVSTQMPTATDRTCGIASVTIRTPFGSSVLRQVTGEPLRTSGARSLGAALGGDDRELLALGHRGLVPQRGLPREPDLPVGVDLDDLDRDHVPVRQHVGDGADARLRDLGDVE